MEFSGLHICEYVHIYRVMMVNAPLETKRWELYGLLADPVRLRLLRLVAEEELAIVESGQCHCESTTALGGDHLHGGGGGEAKAAVVGHGRPRGGPHCG